MGNGEGSLSTTTFLVDQDNRIRAFHGMGNELDENKL